MEYGIWNMELKNVNHSAYNETMNNPAGFFHAVASDHYAMMSCDSLSAKLGNDKLLVIDVRRKGDYSVSRIPGSMHCEWKDLGGLVESGVLDKHETVVVSCYVGQSSSLAAGILRTLNIRAYSLLDGFSGWVASSLPVETG